MEIQVWEYGIPNNVARGNNKKLVWGNIKTKIVENILEQIMKNNYLSSGEKLF